jgi:signal transduction histidine kinase
VEVAAYRIAQEAMTNVVRHAGARHCRVNLSIDEESGSLSLEVEDDGRGTGRGLGPGVGLSSMRERAEELGGTLVVGPSPSGGGTLVRAELPCPSGRHA